MKNPVNSQTMKGNGLFLQWILKIVVHLIIATSKTIDLANTLMNQKFIWILMFIMVSRAMTVQTASINSEVHVQEGGNKVDLIKFLKNDNENSTFSTYRTTQFNVNTFETEMVTVVDTVSNEIDTNCAMIPLWKQVCTDDESTCQLADIEIQTSENSIIILTQALFTLN